METDRRHRGVYVILVTPFDEQGRIDEESLRAEVDFCVEASAHGLVTPANASEFFTLSDSERESIGEAVINQCARRMPVIGTRFAQYSSITAQPARGPDSGVLSHGPRLTWTGSGAESRGESRAERS